MKPKLNKETGIHLQNGTGGRGEWLAQQTLAQHIHFLCLWGKKMEEWRERGKSHMAWEPIPVTCVTSSLWINAGWLLESEPTCHPSVHLYISHTNGPI